MQVGDRRAELEAEDHYILKVEPPRRLLDEVFKCGAGQRLQNDKRSGLSEGLVGPDDVGMGQPLQEPSLAQHAAPVAQDIQTVWAQGLGDAAAPALRAPHLIDVEHIPTPYVGDDFVTRGKLVAF